ncbi:probable calcium-binding protein CML45 [Phoenix dactylifera]|uniref:Probable calcium-binding protein CML45 n=1 Tax=Phoenix dactylifera TaxID=42345 RepID=A0A8B7CTI3_PHODC|nr:probable calcium-binding protein CML45 [Phoenix dactylifera]
MEKASPRSLHHSISLAEPVGLLFFCRILSWLIMTLRKFSLRSFSFLHSYTELFAFSSAVDEDHLMKSTPSQPRGNMHLSREDVEMVMGRMGLCCSQEDDQLGCMGSDEISGVFNEKEPSLWEVKEAFCVFDENGDGFIDALELQRILSMLGFGEGSDFDSCKRMIAAYDENRDGRIDFNEFVKFMEISFC